MKRHWSTGTKAACIAAALAAPIQAATAQEFNEVQAVIKPQLNIERARHMRRLIRERGEAALKQRMGDGAPDAVLPLAYGEDGTAALEDDEESEPRGINLWIDGNGGRLEDSQALRGYDGTQFVASFGGDAEVNDRLIAGVIGLHSRSDIDNIFVPGGSSTRAWGLGPYAAVFLSDTIVLTASALHTWTDNAMDSGPVTASYASRDWALNASVTSYHFVGNWQIAPTAGISYGIENDEGYADSAASAFASSTTHTGSFAFGGKIAYTHALENGMTLVPSLEAEGEWTFERVTTATTSVPADTREFDASVTAGLDVQMSEAAALSFTGSVNGLAKPDYLSVTGGARLTISF